MGINPVEGKTVHICTEELEGTHIRGQAELLITSPKGQFDRGQISKEIATICDDAWRFFQEQFEDSWIGIFRVVVSSDPKVGVFEIMPHYDLMLIPDYTFQDLADMCEEAHEVLVALEKFQELFFTFDFRIMQSPNS